MALDCFPGATGPLSTPGSHQLDLLTATRWATVVAWLMSSGVENDPTFWGSSTGNAVL